MRKFTKALVVAVAVLGGLASTQVAHAYGPYGYGGHDHNHGSYGHNHGPYGHGDHFHGNPGYGYGGYHNHAAGAVHWNGGGVHWGNNGVRIHTGGYGQPRINIGFGNGGFLFGIH